MIGRVTETFAWTRFDLACAVIGERSLQKVGGANGTLTFVGGWLGDA